MTVYLIPQDHLPALRASPVSFSSLSGVRKVWERLWDLEIAPWKHVLNEERLRHNWHGFDLNSDPQGFIQPKKWCWNHSLGLCLLGLIFLSTRYFCPCFSANNTGQIISFDRCFEGFWAFLCSKMYWVGESYLLLSLHLLRCRINVLDSDVLLHGKSPLAPDTLVYLCKRYRVISAAQNKAAHCFWFRRSYMY